MTFYVILSLLLGAPGGGYKLELTGPATPYARVIYELGTRAGVRVVGLSKIFTADFGRRDEVSVVDDDAVEALDADLRALEACALPDDLRPRARSVYRLTCAAGGGFTVHDPLHSADSRYAQVIARLRGFVTRRAPRARYRDPLLRPGEFGWLRINAAIPARVYIDGILLEGQTPLSERVTVGKHVVEMAPIEAYEEEGSTAGGPPPERRRYEVRVGAGRTTSLAVELE